MHHGGASLSTGLRYDSLRTIPRNIGVQPVAATSFDGDFYLLERVRKAGGGMSDKQWSDHKAIHVFLILMAGYAVVALCAGASRLWGAGWQLAQFGDILRWREALSMFLFAPALAMFFGLLAVVIGKGRPHLVTLALTILTAYFVGCGMGMHDPMNRVQSAYLFKAIRPEQLQTTILYLDDYLGHWVFWAGFLLGSWTLGIQQTLTPLDQELGMRPLAAIGILDLVLLWVMLTNLWNEYPKTIPDLSVIATGALIPTLFWIFRKDAKIMRMPFLLILAPTYWGGILGTLLCWTFRGYWWNHH